VGVDRATKYIFAEIYKEMTIKKSCTFLQKLIDNFPTRITHILTDNGAQFTYKLLAKHLQPKDSKLHKFDEICHNNGIEHRLTKFRSPWTNGQVEIMNKMLKKLPSGSSSTKTLMNIKSICQHS
jgi:transposase InsO family protein